jgi:hypothetical protein
VRERSYPQTHDTPAQFIAAWLFLTKNYYIFVRWTEIGGGVLLLQRRGVIVERKKEIALANKIYVSRALKNSTSMDIIDKYYVYTFWWGNLRERDRWGDPDLDGRIILRWTCRKWDGVVGTGWIWLRIGTGGGHL